MNATERVDGWMQRLAHFERVAQSGVRYESVSYDHDTLEAEAIVCANDVIGNGFAKCNAGDKPDKRVGVELARARAITDAATRMLLGEIARDYHGRASGIVCAIEHAVRQAMADRRDVHKANDPDCQCASCEEARDYPADGDADYAAIDAAIRNVPPAHNGSLCGDTTCYPCPTCAQAETCGDDALTPDGRTTADVAVGYFLGTDDRVHACAANHDDDWAERADATFAAQGLHGGMDGLSGDGHDDGPDDDGE
jgi:hypothetical protein